MLMVNWYYVLHFNQVTSLIDVLLRAVCCGKKKFYGNVFACYVFSILYTWYLHCMICVHLYIGYDDVCNSVK